jgi:hypothetical protein
VTGRNATPGRKAFYGFLAWCRRTGFTHPGMVWDFDALDPSMQEAWEAVGVAVLADDVASAA